eukprot:5066725-Alexandrium_andersonii.AAC.1
MHNRFGRSDLELRGADTTSTFGPAKPRPGDSGATLSIDSDGDDEPGRRAGCSFRGGSRGRSHHGKTQY